MLSSKLFATLVLASMTSVAFAGGEYIKNRRANGQGTYNEFNKSPTGHSLTINADGRTGRYCINGSSSCGRLDNIEFGAEGIDVRGMWHFGNSSGTFTWNFQDEKQFFGSFRFGLQPDPESGSIYFPTDGDWNGRFN